MGGAVAVGVGFEEGEEVGLDEDRSLVLEVVEAVVFFLPPSPFFLLLVWLDIMATI